MAAAVVAAHHLASRAGEAVGALARLQGAVADPVARTVERAAYASRAVVAAPPVRADALAAHAVAALQNGKTIGLRVRNARGQEQSTQGAGSREPGAGSRARREPQAEGSGAEHAGSREQGAGSREPQAEGSGRAHR